MSHEPAVVLVKLSIKPWSFCLPSALTGSFESECGSSTSKSPFPHAPFPVSTWSFEADTGSLVMPHDPSSYSGWTASPCPNPYQCLGTLYTTSRSDISACYLHILGTGAILISSLPWQLSTNSTQARRLWRPRSLQMRHTEKRPICLESSSCFSSIIMIIHGSAAVEFRYAALCAGPLWDACDVLATSHCHQDSLSFLFGIWEPGAGTIWNLNMRTVRRSFVLITMGFPLLGGSAERTDDDLQAHPPSRSLTTARSEVENTDAVKSSLPD